jgi:hypothetical protein
MEFLAGENAIQEIFLRTRGQVEASTKAGAIGSERVERLAE